MVIFSEKKRGEYFTFEFANLFTVKSLKLIGYDNYEKIDSHL